MFLQLRPTQYNVGYAQVSKLVAKTNVQLGGATSKKEMKKKLRDMNRKKKVPVVIGPDEDLYMVDHHHWARALWESDVKFSKKKVYYYILNDFSHLEPADFWEQMKLNKLVYLNSCGQLQSPEGLPTDVTGLLDDPYRALARSVRGKRKGWKKTKLPFTEFLWADYLRSYSASFSPIVAEGEQIEAENRAVYDFAVKLCRAESAAQLPGYLGPPRASPQTDSRAEVCAL